MTHAILFQRAKRYHKQGQMEAARNAYEAALSIAPDDSDIQHHYAILLYQTGNYDKAIGTLAHVLRVESDNDNVLEDLLNIHLSCQQYQQAITCYETIVRSHTVSIRACFYAAQAYYHHADFAQAQSLCAQLWCEHQHIEAGVLYGLCLQHKEQLHAAETHYRTLLQQDPHQVDALNNLAQIEIQQSKFDDAIDHLNTALTLDNHQATLYSNLAYCYFYCCDYANCRATIERAFNQRIASVELYCLLGYVQIKQKAYQDAQRALDAALQRMPLHLNSLVARCYLTFMLAEFDNQTYYREQLRKACHSHTDTRYVLYEHYMLLHVCSDMHTLQYLSRHVAERFCHAYDKREQTAKKTSAREKIRLAYVSYDLNQHCVGLLFNDLCAYHDRSEFSVTAYHLGACCDETTEIIAQSVDNLVYGHQLCKQAIIARLRQEADICIDLSGFTGETTHYVLCEQPAPIQVHMLGDYPPFNVPYIHYYISHATETPLSLVRDFSEKMVHMPDCPYARTQFAQQIPICSRDELGLSAQDVVIACFAQEKRIDNDVLRAWACILNQCPQSRLWLQIASETMRHRITTACKQLGCAQQLVFCPPCLNSETAYIAHADIVLDTFIVSGGTLNILAVHYNIPVVTKCGVMPHTRYTAALNASLGLDELVTTTDDAYIACIVRLICNKAYRSRICEIITQRKMESLFAPQKYVAQLECAYHRMWQRRLQNLPPEHIIL